MSVELIKKKAYLVYCTISKAFIVTGMPMQKDFPQYIDVCSVEVDFPVPHDFFSGGAELAALKRKRSELSNKAAIELAEIDRHIKEMEAKNAD